MGYGCEVVPQLRLLQDELNNLSIGEALKLLVDRGEGNQLTSSPPPLHIRDHSHNIHLVPGNRCDAVGLLGEAILRVDQYLLWLAIDATALDQHPWQLCSRANAQPVGSIVRQDYVALLKKHQANISLSSLLSFKEEDEEERLGAGGSRGRLGSLQASHWLRSQVMG